MFGKVLIFGMLAVVVRPQEATVSDDQVAVWFTAAQRAKASGDLAQAETDYKKVILARPDLAEARSNLGLVHYVQGRYDDALKQFEQALRLKPGLETPLLFSGICYQKMGKYDKAVTFFQRLLATPHWPSEADLYLALSYSGLGDEERAYEWFDKFVAVNPKDAEALYQLGGSYLRLSSKNVAKVSKDSFLFARTQAELGELLNRPMEALCARYEEAISLRPSYPNLHWRLARLWLSDGNTARAQSALAEELTVEPDHIPTLLMIAELKRRSGEVSGERESLARVDSIAAAIPRSDRDFAALAQARPARAVSFLNVLLEMGEFSKTPTVQVPTWPALADLDQTLETLWKNEKWRVGGDWPLEVYARARMARNEFTLLCDQLTALSRQSADWEMPRYLLAEVYRRLSVNTYARMAEVEPDGYRTLLLKAETLDDAHYYSDAAKTYRAAMSARPDAAGIHYRLGLLLLNERQLSEAISEFEQELVLDPRNTQARVALGEAYVEQYQLEKAVPILHRAIEEDPKAPSAFLSLARAYLMQGDPSAAAPMFERALKLMPEDVNAHYQLAQTYQELGRAEEADREFAIVKRLRTKYRAPH